MQVYVNKDEFVFLTSEAYNTKASGGEDSRVLIACMQKDKKGLKSKVLDYTDDYEDLSSAIKYRKADSSIYLSISMEAESAKCKPIMDYGKKTTGYTLQMNVFNALTLQVKKTCLLNIHS